MDIKKVTTTHSPSKKIMCSFRNVSKAFALKSHSTQILYDIDIEVPEGSFTILYGPSGSGKSTILNTMAGLQPPTSGKVIINGVDIYSLPADARARFRAETLGMVHQDNYWVNSLSVEENVAMPLLLDGWDKKDAVMAADKNLARVGLQGYESYNPTVLSGGQQQRVSFARATVTQPKLILADEPTGNLDSKNGKLIIDLMLNFNRLYNTTLVLVTHNLELLSLSDNVIKIRDGHVVHRKSINKTLHSNIDANTTKSQLTPIKKEHLRVKNKK